MKKMLMVLVIMLSWVATDVLAFGTKHWTQLTKGADPSVWVYDDTVKLEYPTVRALLAYRLGQKQKSEGIGTFDVITTKFSFNCDKYTYTITNQAYLLESKLVHSVGPDAVPVKMQHHTPIGDAATVLCTSALAEAPNRDLIESVQREAHRR